MLYNLRDMAISLYLYIYISLYLYIVVISVNVEWCIGKSLSTSITSYSISCNHNTNIHNSTSFSFSFSDHRTNTYVRRTTRASRPLSLLTSTSQVYSTKAVTYPFLAKLAPYSTNAGRTTVFMYLKYRITSTPLVEIR